MKKHIESLKKAGVTLSALAAAAWVFHTAPVMLAELDVPQVVPGMTASVSVSPAIRLMAARTVELEAKRGGHFIVRAEINRTPVTVLVDTGATKVALSYEDADRAGLRPRLLDFTIPVATANGTAKAASVVLRQVEIENILVRDVEALVLQKGALRGTLLGMSFLKRLSSFRMEDGRLILRE